MSIERRIEKLENYQEAKDPEKLTIIKVVYAGIRDPTDEEVDSATEKFLKEHPDHKGHIVLDFLHLREERNKRRKEKKIHGKH